MSDIIQLLPDSVANQIAAGEVIQRPASVVKELMENSIDAGATQINVLVVDAGRTSIQVVDNGKGMSETDARLAFERHATSKIRKADDLFALQTMGFRGEALPSIVAVSEVELRTRQTNQEVGTQLNFAGSKVLSQRPCSCAVGCNFRVSNLFYNVPARRKFLKSNATELNNILTAFERIVLVYPDIAFTFHSNGGELYNLRPGNLRQRISDVFNKKLSQDLLPLEADTTMCRLYGFVAKPEAARKKNAQQFFFVNGRYMKHPYFASAVQTAFERLVPKGEHVPFFIYFEVQPSAIDVNIHPTKTEIKFENEQAIWQILAAAVREAVGVFNELPTIDFDVESRPDIPEFNATSTPVPSPSAANVFNPSYNPFRTEQKKPSRVENWEELYPSRLSSLGSDSEESLSATAPSTDYLFSQVAPTDLATQHYQLKGRHILTSDSTGLLVIDQHRAHVRVLYEQYLDRMNKQQSPSQRMLFPEAVQFTTTNEQALQTILSEMARMGFELTPLGARNYAINSVPSGLEGLNASSLVQEMVDDAITAADINSTLALSMARRVAIPYGQVLSNDEMNDLVTRLFACENVNYTPDGHRIFFLLSDADIASRLK